MAKENKNFVDIEKDGVTRTVSRAELYDWLGKGWKSKSGESLPADAKSALKDLEKANADLAAAKAELEKAAESLKAKDAEIEKLTAEKAELEKAAESLKAELDKASKK